MKRKNQNLSQQYYRGECKGSYGGVDSLKRASKLKRSTVKNWLQSQDAYTLHKPVCYNFSRRRTIVGGRDHQWQADLIDMRALKKYNNKFTFVLMVIDVLSKYAWAVPLKNKTGQSLTDAFKKIFLTSGRKPFKLQSDKGSEFLNKTFLKFLTNQDVCFFTSENDDVKCSIVERLNRTIKARMWRYFTKKGGKRYVEILPKLMKSYNNSFHSSIKRAPIEVDKDNEADVWETLYGNWTMKEKDLLKRFEVGDRVRISKSRRNFRKGYLPSWTEEKFTVSRIQNTLPITYFLKDDKGEELLGTFYSQELQKVISEKTNHRIEKVLNMRIFNASREYLIRWRGKRASFDSWIPESDLEKYL